MDESNVTLGNNINCFSFLITLSANIVLTLLLPEEFTSLLCHIHILLSAHSRYILTYIG